MAFRPFRRRIQQPAELAMLRARRFIQLGRFEKAGMLLAELAASMDAAGRPRLAGELHARAAHCYVEAGRSLAAQAEAEAALRAFQQAGLPERMAHFQRVIAAKMQGRGLQAGVEALQAQFGRPASPDPASVSGRRANLPVACGQCGAPLHPAEVEWIDERTAECAYCGAVIAAS